MQPVDKDTGPCAVVTQVRKMAPEFYDCLPSHTSWVRVIWDFIFDHSSLASAHNVTKEHGSGMQ